MRNILLSALLISFLFCGLAMAQVPSLNQQPLDRMPNYQEMRGLLNGSQFDISHQMSLNYSTVSSGPSQMTGLYVSTLHYKTDSPLDVRLHLGYKYQPSQLNDFSQDTGVVPGVSVRYNFKPGHILGFSYGINEHNSQIYNYLEHDQKPFDVWYEGNFLDNSLQMNIRVTNQPVYYNSPFYDSWSTNPVWNAHRYNGF